MFTFILACTDVTKTEASEKITLVSDTASEQRHDCFEERYMPIEIQGWAVCVDHTATSQMTVVENLEEDLSFITGFLEPEVLSFLRTVRIYVEKDIPDFPGAVYHPSSHWLEENGYPTHWAESIQIGNTDNYLSWTDIQPAMVFHELSHAWHHQSLGYDDSTILFAYDEAMDSGIYEDVPYAGGGNQVAYAVNNEMEYFAELSEAWFWVNDFYPFVQADLLTFDPLGAEMVFHAWTPE
jgi:hypothetical protein